MPLENLIQTAVANSRLMYFELITLRELLDFFNNRLWLIIRLLFTESFDEQFAILSSLKKYGAILEQAHDLYQHFQPLLAGAAININQVLAIHQAAEERLGLLYRTRHALLEEIESTLFGAEKLITPDDDTPQTHITSELIAELKDLRHLISSSDSTLEDITGVINYRGMLDDTRRESFENTLKEWKNRSQQITDALASHKQLQDILLYRLSQLMGTEFPIIYRQCATTLLLQYWLRYIQQEYDRLNKQDRQNSNIKELTHVLAVKQVLINSKAQVQLQFYRQVDIKIIGKLWPMAIEYFNTATEETLTSFMQKKLQTETTTLREEINHIEAALKDYGWSVAIASSITRLWSESYYFKMSNNYFDLIDELTPSVPFTPNYSLFFKTTGSLLLVGIDTFLQRWLTGTEHYGYLSILHQLLIPQLETIISLLENLGVAEKTAVDLAPTLKLVLGFTMFAGVNLLTMGFTSANLGFATLSYITLTLLQELINDGLKSAKTLFIEDEKQDKISSDAWDCIVQPLVTFVGQTLHGRYIAPINFRLAYELLHNPEKLTASVDETAVLNDSFMCLQHSKLCEQVVFKILGLHPNATKNEIRAVLRPLFLGLHADRRQHPDNARLFNIRQAKARLNDLSTKFEIPIPQEDAAATPTTMLALQHKDTDTQLH